MQEDKLPTSVPSPKKRSLLIALALAGLLAAGALIAFANSDDDDDDAVGPTAPTSAPGTGGR